MDHSESPSAKVLFYNLSKPRNIGPIVRSCCAFGVTECLVASAGGRALNQREAKVKFGAQGTHLRMPTTYHDTLADAVSALKNDRYHIVGVEITAEAKPLETNPFPSKRVCFLFGNEGDGLIPAAMKVCDSFVYIRQYGQKTASLNVSVAAGIVLYQWAQWAQLAEAPRLGNKFVVTEPQPVLIGTYSTHQGHVKGEGKGVYKCRVSPHTGLLTDLELLIERTDASYLALMEVPSKPGHTLLLSVSESGKAQQDGLDSCLLDRSLTVVHKYARVATGCAPCHIEVVSGERGAVVSCYCGGTHYFEASAADEGDAAVREVAAAAPAVPASGVDAARQLEPHPHCFTSLERGLGLAVDLGSDALVCYTLPGLRALRPHLPVPGGPRHFALHPTLSGTGYVACELANTVHRVAFSAIDASVEWDLGPAVSTLPAGFAGKASVSAIKVHPNGRILFVANRFHDSITSFRLDEGGRLVFLDNVPCQGRTPRDLTLLPDGGLLLVANQDSSSVACFLVDAGSGQLRYTGQKFPVPSPACILCPE